MAKELKCAGCKTEVVKNSKGYFCPVCKTQLITLTGNASVTVSPEGAVKFETK